MEKKKWVVVTGATSGIGYATSKRLLSEGYAVLGVGSRPDRAETAKKQLLEEVPEAELIFLSADLSSLEEVRSLGTRIIEFLNLTSNGHLHALINNAGCLRDRYEETVDGYEHTFALNHLSNFLLSHLLKPYLKGGIILFTSSYIHRLTKIHWKDVMYKKGYFVLWPYRQSKLCNVMTAKELDSRWKNDGIRCFAVDPGLVKTSIGVKGTHWWMKVIWWFQMWGGHPAEYPAKTFAYLCDHPDSEGLYFKNGKPSGYNKEVDRIEERAKLYDSSCRWCHL